MSKFVVSARKYRPLRFKDVVGQEHVSNTLKHAMISDHLAHAFLFCGPRGVGKTTCARILAKVLNCENPSEDKEPCGTCGSCKSFDSNSSFNIIELDAASNNSVEHIRNLTEQVRFQPQQGEYKIFIIDEVHMLSSAAFNAFLKTLEEPPSYAVFILATTEKHKIIPTILSRCQIFDFKRIQIDSMVAHLSSICEEEGIEAESDALHMIAQKADGALRDALSIFDRIVSYSGDKITYQDVITNLNVLDYDYYFKIVESFLTEDLSGLLLLFDEILKAGFDAHLFMNGLSEHFRNLLVAKSTAVVDLIEVGDNTKQRYLEQSKATPKGFILSCLHITQKCDVDFRFAKNKRLHVETALIKMCFLNSVREATVTSTEQKKNAEPKQVAPVPKPSNPSAPVSTAPTSIETQVEKSTPVASPEAKVISTPKVVEEVNAGPSVVKEVPDKPYLAMSKDLMKTSKGLLSQLEQKVEKEVVASGAKPSRLSYENLKESWQKFIDSLDSPSLQNHFQVAELDLEGKNITVRVPRKLNLSAIKEEDQLLIFLREDLVDNHLMMQVVLDESLLKDVIDNAPAKPLTLKEKYMLMAEQNEYVEPLIKRFGLKPSN